ncbi:hypothetical protein B0H16DRAFT_1418763 [Mycena metata]|uniref:Uncharacterized protein n=1 Tax=Mycena metata TaxID=1033252 RepID=A0AAD7IXX4_9AGAR|nr:hypothetical protein B0H16DRAFT_1418763 [Mycena metata]
MSVTNQVLGKNSTLLQVPFLNLMANIVQRAGSVMVRVGGNSQESAHLVAMGEILNGRVLSKNLTGVTGTTQTPPLDFTPDLLYMMRNISELVNVHWFLGIPWWVEFFRFLGRVKGWRGAGDETRPWLAWGLLHRVGLMSLASCFGSTSGCARRAARRAAGAPHRAREARYASIRRLTTHPPHLPSPPLPNLIAILKKNHVHNNPLRPRHRPRRHIHPRALPPRPPGRQRAGHVQPARTQAGDVWAV